MEYINAFWVGGLICALVQILLEKTKLLPGRVMVLLVCTGAVLGSFGIYDKLIDFAGAGASVPLLGFGNTLFQGVKKAISEHGFLGIFMGGFTASAVGRGLRRRALGIAFDPELRYDIFCETKTVREVFICGTDLSK